MAEEKLFFPRPDKNVRPERRAGFRELQALSKQPASEAKRNGSGCAARKPKRLSGRFYPALIFWFFCIKTKEQRERIPTHTPLGGSFTCVIEKIPVGR
jgi:hypothetical protein